MARGELTEAHDDERQDRADAEHLEQAAAAFGLLIEGVSGSVRPCFYLWPENVPAWQFFVQCRTQWRHGFAGPTGLDYAGVDSLMGQLRIGVRARRRLWPLVRACERGYLEGQHEAAAERAQHP